MAIIKWTFNVIFFFLFFKYSNCKFLYAMDFGIKIAMAIGSLYILFVVLKNGSLEYDRGEIFIDKAFLTSLFALSYFFCILDIFFNRDKIFNIILFSVSVFVNLFVVQSKTSLFALVIELLILYFFFPIIRPVYNKYIKYLVIIGFLAFTILPSVPLPDDLTYGINRVLGFEFLDESKLTRSYNNLSMTYDIRDDVRAYCFRLFLENPILGIGQGNFAILNQASSNDFNWLSETESSWLQILTEGGLFYFLTMIFLFFKPINDAYKKLKNEVGTKYSYYYLMTFSFFIIFIVLFLFNDFSDSFFWISAGIMASLIVCDKTESPTT